MAEDGLDVAQVGPTLEEVGGTGVAQNVRSDALPKTDGRGVPADYLEGARSDYDRAIDLDPRFPAPRYNRGLDLLNAGRAQEALADFDAALAIYPADAWALNNRGLARLRLGRSAEAIEDFEKALSVEADLAAAKRNLDRVRRTLPQSMPAASQAAHPSQHSQLSEPSAAATSPVPDSAEATGPRP